jgi:phosphonate transport system ATP-binding protein
MLDVRGVTRMFGQKAAVDNMTFSVDRPAFDDESPA